MKNLIKKNMPKSILIFLQNFLLFWRLLNYKKPKFFCTVCENNTYGYLTGFFPKLTITCNNCLSESKQRLISQYLKNYNFKNKSILHFAPEDCMIKFINKNNIYTKYILADINPTKEIKKVDITDIEFQNNTFDLIICSHVLEHVNEKKAIKELKRIIKVNGSILLLFPIIDSWDKTYRNDNITNDYDRERHFLQHDHLQLFGREIEKELSDDNFSLKKITPFGKECVKYGINQGESLFVLEKNR